MSASTPLKAVCPRQTSAFPFPLRTATDRLTLFYSKSAEFPSLTTLSSQVIEASSQDKSGQVEMGVG